jgi:hypothetical protein
MFAVLQLNKEVEVNVMGREVGVPLSYAAGMIGAIPVFDTRENAEEFSGDKYDIAEITTREI